MNFLFVSHFPSQVGDLIREKDDGVYAERTSESLLK